MQLTLERRDRLVIARPAGEMTEDEALDDLVREVTDAMTPDCAGIVLDMSAATFVSSSGLGALVRIVAQGNLQECAVLLAAPTPSLAGVLEVTRLNRFIRVRDSLPEALSELAIAARDVPRTTS
jgi:anti-sigma B factor antagonist